MTNHKSILLTGHSKGLGLATAKLLLAQDFTVYGISRSTTLELASLQEQYTQTLHTLQYDLSNSTAIRQEVFRTWLDGVQLYGFVNNAAMPYDTLLTNMNLETVQKMTAVNQITPMIMTKYVIRNMLLHRIKGSIVHLSSVTAHTGYKGLSMYAANKGALEAFSKNTAREWGTKGIRSNCVAAGFMETNMTSVLDADTKDRIYKRTSLKAATDLSSVAETILFLLSEKSNSITGQVLHVDNGTI